eukprot:CAMPEP_0175386132 /NCGR_PEP_ID=MMETSP0095-20121207/29201_1 /TAXON_ID=311494 /ORGANISM="Alexandrium monilatum, Strain CCMP3105" /LENGTH=129 /DNA_ID=CAMNT_0016684573 /DNA_START=76 /DNA_END=461 /DNA_ORIENTATION=+
MPLPGPRLLDAASAGPRALTARRPGVEAHVVCAAGDGAVLRQWPSSRATGGALGLSSPGAEARARRRGGGGAHGDHAKAFPVRSLIDLHTLAEGQHRARSSAEHLVGLGRHALAAPVQLHDGPRGLAAL